MTDHKKRLLDEQYNNFIELVQSNFPIESMHSLFVPDLMGFGVNLDEKVLNLKELQDAWRLQIEQAVGLDLSFMVIPIYRRISKDENVAIKQSIGHRHSHARAL